MSNRIHVLSRREELDHERLPGRVAIVLDVLFATTTIVTALAHGARAVVPVVDGAAAQRAAQAYAPEDRVLAGEHMAVTIEGFVSPLPMTLVAHGVRDKTVIYSTTNGTVALKGAAGADYVYAAALVNGRATAEHVIRAHPGKTLLIVCSGSVSNMNIEDLYGAGYLVELMSQILGEKLNEGNEGNEGADLSDAARVARALYRNAGPEESLLGCRVGRMASRRGDESEVRHAAQLSVFDLVAQLKDGKVVRV